MKRTSTLLAGLFSGCALLLTNALSPRECGDGLLDPERDEQCDDGNTDRGDGCSEVCLLESSCGDTLVEAAEVCDDGNQNNGDGCAADCLSLDCGDGLVQPNEGCDDGNQNNGDGCSALCLLESCGDGLLDSNEECDDSNVLSDDGCDRFCRKEADRFVFCGGGSGGSDGSAGAPFSTIQAAHDAANPGERIMILPGSATCAESVTLTKSITILGPAERSARSLPLVDGGASAAFLAETDATTITLKHLSITSTADGGAVKLDGGANLALLGVEITNPNNSNNNAAAIECLGASHLLLDQAIVHDSPGCGLHVKPNCKALASNTLFQGNGAASARGAVRVDNNGSALVILSTFDNNNNSAGVGVMECGGNALVAQLNSVVANNNNGNNAVDTTDCTTSASVVFGVNLLDADSINLDPAFVDPAANDFRLRASSPLIDAANPNTLSLFDPVALFGVDVLSHDFAGSPRPRGATRDIGMFEAPPCGDGVVEPGEDCDDTNKLNGDGCNNNCTFPGCGNFVIDGAEGCDDNNQTPGDGCNALCAVESCGDGLVNNASGSTPTEQCDDTNNNNGDGCNASCVIEAGFECNGAPSVCSLSCGNGFTEANEDCDDGNNNNGDGCDAACNVERCGDSLVNNNAEQCDDGDQDNGDGCDGQCRFEITSEQEPNDDGSPSQSGQDTTGNDFDPQNPLDRGVITSSRAIRGVISPQGDEDIFAVQNVSATPLSLRVETTSVIGAAVCNFDSVISIRDANNNDLSTDNDNGENKCSLIQDFTLNPGVTVFVQVFSFADNSTFEYFLTILLQ